MADLDRPEDDRPDDDRPIDDDSPGEALVEEEEGKPLSEIPEPNEPA